MVTCINAVLHEEGNENAEVHDVITCNYITRNVEKEIRRLNDVNVLVDNVRNLDDAYAKRTVLEVH